MQNILVYPKDYLRNNSIVDRRKCFFIMPYNDNGNSTFAHLSEALRKHDYIPIRIDMLPSSQSIMHDILDAIATSNYVIVDISGCNPNVFYELGIAHVFKNIRNVIIIKDKETKTPTDILHLRYTEYSKENYMLLEENIISILDEMAYITELDLALSEIGIVNNTNDKDDILALLDSFYTQKQLSVMTKLLNNDQDLSEADIADLYAVTEKMLSEVCYSKSAGSTLVTVLSSLYARLLTNCPINQVIQPKLEKILSDYYVVSDSKINIALKTDIALQFLQDNKLLEIAIPWIIEYFSKSKTAHIDLNRYKIEAFLTSKNNDRFDEYIIAALESDDRHIREHMADIVAEKALYSAANVLRRQLSKETNIYSATSIIEAIGVVGQFDDILLIEEWISSNFNMINNPGGNMIFKHALSAIISLEQGHNNDHSTMFEKLYGNLFIH